MGRFADAADSLAEAPRICSLGRFLTGLPDDERSELTKVLEARYVVTGRFVRSNAYVRKLIADIDGRRFGEGTISDHRNGRCPCPGS